MQTAIQIVQPPTGQVQTVSVASPAVEQVPAFCGCIPYECSRILVLMMHSMNRFFYFEFLLSSFAVLLYVVYILTQNLACFGLCCMCCLVITAYDVANRSIVKSTFLGPFYNDFYCIVFFCI